METMPLTLDWLSASTRLACALVAGAAFGFDRSESGKAAGLRTTILVCLAACVAMLQVNALLPETGKQPNSFATLDLMRLPLGILTGMGFIGAGAVFRKDGLISGVTTAAMLWFVTVIGLCLGGGQYRLGGGASVVGLAVMWGLRMVEHKLERRKAAWLTIKHPSGSDCTRRLADELARIGCSVEPRGGERREEGTCESRYLVHWKEPFDVHRVAPSFEEIGRASGALSLQWSMTD
jgi:putative Mg2+ transporter-C (MgtC) family protein|nr:MgtC/SapB family protein [Trinickia diaoshuihuensis]